MSTRIACAVALLLPLGLPAQAGSLTDPGDVEVVTGTPNTWFPRTRLAIGEVYGKKSVVGTFAFRNPTGAAVQWSGLRGTCACARAVIEVGGQRFELSEKPVANSLHRLVDKPGGEPERIKVQHIDVPAGASGSIEVHMGVERLIGPKTASMEITSTDPGMKHVRLVWKVVGLAMFVITPGDIPLGEMAWNVQKPWSFRVRSDVLKDFALREHAVLPDYVKVTGKKKVERADGKPEWLVEGTFGPKPDPKTGGAAVRFSTDQEGQEVGVRITATIVEPLILQPASFLSFGRVDRSKGAEQEIVIRANDGTTPRLLGVEYPRLSFDRKFISTTSRLRGKELVVTVRIAPGTTGSVLMRGALVLKLDHPVVSRQEFGFNGVLR